MDRRQFLIAFGSVLTVPSTVSAAAPLIHGEPPQFLTLKQMAEFLLAAGDETSAIYAEHLSRATPLLEVLPFATVAAEGFDYLAEGRLPGVGFTTDGWLADGVGLINPTVDRLLVNGGDLDIDAPFYEKMVARDVPMDRMSLAMHARNLGRSLTRQILSGAGNHELFGLRWRVRGPMLKQAHPEKRLEREVVDDLIDAVPGANHLVMSMRARNAFLSRHDIRVEKDEYGARRYWWDDHEVLTAGYDEAGQEMMREGGTTSIFAVNIGPEGLVGLQSGAPRLVDQGVVEADFDGVVNLIHSNPDRRPMSVKRMLPTSKVRRQSAVWSAGVGVFSGRAVGRLTDIHTI